MTTTDGSIRVRARPAALVLAAVIAVAATGLAVAAAAAGGTSPKLAIIPALFAVAGAVIAAEQPHNGVGWLLLVIALGFGGVALAGSAMESNAWAGWFVGRGSAFLVPATLALLLLIPDGRLPSPGWRPVALAAVSAQAALVAVWATAAGPANPDAAEGGPANPLGILPVGWGDAATTLETWVLQVPLLLVVPAVALRLRQAQGDQRRRLVAVLLAGVAFVFLVVVGRALWPAASDILDVTAAGLLAATLTSAVLRRRVALVGSLVAAAVVYGTLIVLIAVLHAGLVSVVSDRLGPVTALGGGVLAGVAALLVLPLRRPLAALLDRARFGEPSDAVVRRLTTQLLDSRRQLVTAREDERARLRRDLHDQLGPTLAGLSMQLAGLPALIRTDPDIAVSRLPRLEGAARAALEDVRRMSRDLRPPSLDELGIVGALAALADDLGVALECHVDLELHLRPAAEVGLFRIAAEALTNVARHSGTSTARLDLYATEGEVALRVADRGRGRPGAGLGVGMVTMRERAEELGGTLAVVDTEGGGTTVEARVPATVSP